MVSRTKNLRCVSVREVGGMSAKGQEGGGVGEEGEEEIERMGNGVACMSVRARVSG